MFRLLVLFGVTVCWHLSIPRLFMDSEDWGRQNLIWLIGVCGPFPLPVLSDQQRAVAELVIDGATFHQAAEELHLSTDQVQLLCRQLMQKMEVKTLPELRVMLKTTGILRVLPSDEP